MVSFALFRLHENLRPGKITPMGTRGFKSRICPPYPHRVVKGDLLYINGAVSRNNRIKRLDPGRCLDRHVKEPYETSMALGARP